MNLLPHPQIDLLGLWSLLGHVVFGLFVARWVFKVENKNIARAFWILFWMEFTRTEAAFAYHGSWLQLIGVGLGLVGLAALLRWFDKLHDW